MKVRHYIGFFLTVFLLTCLLGIGYQLSYRYVMDRQSARLEEPVPQTQQMDEKEESITTKGEAEKSEGYYLCALQGYVVVYLSDRETIYEMTEIPLNSLPEQVQTEVEAGKFIETVNELYGFLENYSS